MTGRLIHAVKVLWVCVLGAVLYGILNDQITARICLTYFSEFHPDLGLPADPTILAFAWGIIATWWVGAILGAPLAFIAVCGNSPYLPIYRLIRALGRMFGVMAVGSLLAGLVGSQCPMVAVVAYDQAQHWSLTEQRRFTAVLFAHNAAYFLGFAGGLVVILWAWWFRRQQ